MTTVRRPHGENTDGNVGAELLAFSVPEWMNDGLCAEVDPGIFYPDKGESLRPAKSICARCPVQAACLAYALENDEYWGVWGGSSEYDRAKARKARRAAMREAS